MKIFDKFKENETISKVSKFLSNKRNSALVKLGFWIIFFGIFAIFVRVSNSNKKTIVEDHIYTVPEILESINNYSFDYNIMCNDEELNITGNYNNDEMEFTLYDQRYFANNDFYFINGQTLEQTINPLDINFNKITVSNIYNLIKDEKVLYDTIENDKKTTVYKVNGALINDMINENIIFDDQIEISIITSNNKCESIFIDLTRYMNSKELIYRNYTIKLNIYSINQVSSFSYNFNLEGE